MKKNPKSHKRQRRTTSKTWSQLPSDILISVFERLRFADFRRTKSVCSSWHSASRRSVPKNHIPWLILFPEKDKNNNSCKLFNPEEKDELYKTKDLGLEFGNSVCKATYGSWFLMQDPMHNLYILNVFTEERINLPSVESKLGEAAYSDFKSKSGNHHIRIRSPVFWVDEETKDYVVIWGFEGFCVVYAKKGDTLWKEIPDISECFDMVYKDHKLYFSSFFNIFKIFDFTKDIPQQIFESSMLLYRGDEIIRICSEPTRVIETKLVVSVTGDILKVERIHKPLSRDESFSIYKVYSSSFFKKHQQVCSLGDETMLWDLGITVLANGIEGLKKNSIYFSGGIGNHSTEIFLFDLKTKKMKPLHKFDCSSAQVARARWFLPSFKSKCF